MNRYTHITRPRATPLRASLPSLGWAILLGLFSMLSWPGSAQAEESQPAVFAPSPSLLSSQVAPPISQLTVILNSRKVDTLALHKIQFKLPDTIPSNAGFRVTYPQGFGLDSLVTVLYADSDGIEPNPKFSASPQKSNQSADFFLDSTGAATLPGSTVVLSLVRVKNPTVKGSYRIALEVLARDSALLFGPTLSAPFTLIPSDAKSIDVAPSIPVSVVAGAALQFTAVVRDTFLNVIDTATVSWRVAPESLGLQSGPIFSARRVGGGRVFATYGALQDSSGPITVTPGPLATWDLQGLSPSGLAGSGLPGDSIVVTARDAYGNRKTGYLDSFYFSSTDPAAQFPATPSSPYQFTGADSGRHAFAAKDFILFQAGVDTIYATGGGKSTAQQIAVAPAPAIDFSISAPDTVTAGIPFPVTAAQVQDLYGNLAGGAVTLYLNAADSVSPSGQLPLLPELQAASGAGSVNVRLHRAGVYPLFAAIGDTVRATDSIVVRSAAAARFAFAITEPQYSGLPFVPPATMTAFDPFGNVDVRYAQSGRTVTLSAQNGDPMTQNVFSAAAFSLGDADLAGLGVTYLGRGGPVIFVANDGVAQGASDPVDVIALGVDTVTFDQTEVRRGEDEITGTVVLRIDGVGKVNITALSLETAYGSFPLAIVAPSLPDSFTGPATRAYAFAWPVHESLPQSCIQFGVRVQGAFGAGAVTGEFNGAPCISVVSAAAPTLVSLSPDTVAYAPVRYLATVENSGVRGVTLELSQTRLLVSDGVGRVDTAQSEASGQQFVYPDSSQGIWFVGTHAPAFAGDSAFATLEMRGFEGGRAFQWSTSLPVPLRFRTPGALAYVPNTLSPDTLLLGKAATVFARLANTGGVSIDQIRPESTWMELRGAVDTARLPLGTGTTPLTRLAAGADTLLAFELTAVQARLAGGTYVPHLHLVGEQNHVHYSADLAAGESVELLGEARIRIDSVWVTAPNAPRVSAGQSFLVTAAISNQGLEPLDSIDLALSASAGALFDSSAHINTIPPSDARTAQWTVTADFLPVVLETFSVHIVRAVGRVTGAVATIVPALDPQDAVQVQAPASVFVEAQIYLPPEAADLRVAAGSDFQISAHFVNTGEAQTGGGALRVSVTGGLVVAESTVVTLPPGGDAFWTLSAPSADTTAEIIVSLEGTVDELNTSKPAAVAKSADTLKIKVAFEAPPLLVYDVQFGSGQVESPFIPLRWSWKNNDASGQFPILVRKLEVEMMAGRQGALLDAADYLVSAELDMGGNLVPAEFSNGRLRFGADSLRRIASGDSEQVILRVVPKSGPLFAEFSFATRGSLWSAVERFVNGAGLPVPVLDDRGVSLNIQSPLAFRSGTAPANFPNPFRAGVEPTEIVYSLAQDAGVSIVLYSADGREVWSYDAPAGGPGGRAGANSVVWDGRNGDGLTVIDGVYLARIRGGGLDATLKIAVLK